MSHVCPSLVVIGDDRAVRVKPGLPELLHRIVLGLEVFISLLYLLGALPWMRLAFAVLFLEALPNYVELIH